MISILIFLIDGHNAASHALPSSSIFATDKACAAFAYRACLSILGMSWLPPFMHMHYRRWQWAMSLDAQKALMPMFQWLIRCFLYFDIFHFDAAIDDKRALPMPKTAWRATFCHYADISGRDDGRARITPTVMLRLHFHTCAEARVAPQQLPLPLMTRHYLFSRRRSSLFLPGAMRKRWAWSSYRLRYYFACIDGTARYGHYYAPIAGMLMMPSSRTRPVSVMRRLRLCAIRCCWRLAALYRRRLRTAPRSR